MPSIRSVFNDEDLVPDEISVAMSHGGGSTVSKSSSIMTAGGDPDNDEIVELVRGQCLVIFKRGGRAREVVCAGKYEKCQLKDHRAMQRDERNRSKPGWFRGVFTQKGRLVGGWLDSRMSASEAKQILEGRKAANRRSAGLMAGIRSADRSAPSPKTTPDSGSTWDDCGVNTGDPASGACVALGKQLTAEVSMAPPTLKEITGAIVRKQHQVQREEDFRMGIQAGDRVFFKRGRERKPATVKEIYRDPDGDYYLLEDDRGMEIQVEGHMVVPASKGEEVKNKETSPPSIVPSDPAATLMESMQQMLKLMQQRESVHQGEKDRTQSTERVFQSEDDRGGKPPQKAVIPAPEMWYAIAKGRGQEGDVGVFQFAEAQERLRGAVQPVWCHVNSIAEGMEFIADYQEQQLLALTLPHESEVKVKTVESHLASDVTTRWYAVARGKSPESTGVYPSWAKAAVEVEGVSNACFKSFKTEEEAERFVLEYQEQSQATSLQAALTEMKLNRDTPAKSTVTPVGTEITKGALSDMGGRVSGPDPSQKMEGKLFGLIFMEENTLRQGLVPHPKTLAPQVQMHLLGQALDVTPLPYTVASSTTDSADTGAALSRALATMAGAQTDMDLGGEPMDLNWKTGSKISVASIKTLSQLRERLSELRQGKRAVEQTLLGRISSVLQHAGYEAGSILYRMGCDCQYFYIQLHEHILGQAWDDESSCDFENAKLEIEHHTAELRRRRTMYSSRIMMLCATYVYLRDQSAVNFQSSKLQEKRQKLAMQAMKKQMAQVESTYQKMKELSARSAENNANGRKGDKNKPMCWKCHQAGIHTGGKDNCTWKNLSDDEAKAKALEWVAAKQAQIGGSNK